MFRVNKRDARSSTGLTPFGRPHHELSIDITYANSGQAKGHVERMNLTLQDRLVKELQLEDIDTVEDGNNILLGLLDKLFTRFAKEPLNQTDMQRPRTEVDNLEDSLSWQRHYIVSHNLTIQYNMMTYLPESGELTNEQRHEQVTVHDFPDDTIAIRYDGVSLLYSVFDKVGKIKQADVLSNKRSGAVLEFVKDKAARAGSRSQQENARPK